MSIADKLSKLQTDVTNAYSSIESKGGTIPTNKNTQNLASAIDSITGGGGGITLKSIAITQVGTTEYDKGDTFSLSGYTIIATYSNGSTLDVTSACTFTPSGALSGTDTSITIRYIEGGVSATATQNIAVNEYQQLVNYTMLYDGGLGNATLNECTDITGGWYQNKSQDAGSVTKNTDNITVVAKGYSGTTYSSKQSITHQNSINPVDGGYVKALSLFSMTKQGTPSGGYRFSLAKDKEWVENGSASNVLAYIQFWYTTTATLTKQIAEIDIANISQNGYIQIGVQNNATNSQNKPVTTITYAVILAKTDNWQTLAEKAGITASSIDDVLTNSETLLSNEKAVKYMIYNCTGSFMTSAIQSSTFLTALNNSTYKTIIQANEHWNKFLSMVA